MMYTIMNDTQLLDLIISKVLDASKNTHSKLQYKKNSFTAVFMQFLLSCFGAIKNYMHYCMNFLLHILKEMRFVNTKKITLAYI